MFGFGSHLSWPSDRILKRNSLSDNFTKVWFQLRTYFQMRIIINESPIGSCVKLSSAVVAILAGEGSQQIQL